MEGRRNERTSSFERDDALPVLDLKVVAREPEGARWAWDGKEGEILSICSLNAVLSYNEYCWDTRCLNDSSTTIGSIDSLWLYTESKTNENNRFHGQKYGEKKTHHAASNGGTMRLLFTQRRDDDIVFDDAAYGPFSDALVKFRGSLLQGKSRERGWICFFCV